MNPGPPADLDAQVSASSAAAEDGSGVRAMTGRVLANRWTLTSALGVGGTGTVYEAIHRNGRRVAVKVLHAGLAGHASARRRFLSEGYAANRVRHPDAVGILDDGEEADGTAFLVMELLRGQSFAAILRDHGPLPVPEVVSVALAVLEILAAAHDNGVVHRDIKPGNIFATNEGRIKLLDFGVALIADSSSVITSSGATVGTPAFMAPEQAAGRSAEIDALTDLWAVGATMFQLFTGRLVHDAISSNSALVAAATRAAPPIATIAPNLPPEVAAVVDRALRFERSERWPNARAMHRALQLASGQQALSPLQGASSPETAPEVAASPVMLPALVPDANRSGRRVLIVASAIVAAIACLAWAVRSSSRAVGASASASPAHVTALLSAVSAPLTPLPAKSAALPPPVASVPPSLSAQGTARPHPHGLVRPVAPAAMPDSESSLLDRRK